MRCAIAAFVPAAVVLSATEQPAEDDVCYALRIGSGQSVVGLRGCGQQTARRWRTRSVTTPRCCSGTARELGSLYDVFAREYGVVVNGGEQTVRAESADAHPGHASSESPNAHRCWCRNA